MSGLSSTQTLFTRRGAPLLLAAGALGAALLAGCGGGGGNGNLGGGTTGTTGTTGSTGTTGTTGTGTGGVTGNADVIGRVTDAQGNGIPGATIVPDTGGTAAVTLAQGGYRLYNLTGNVVHRITASVQQGNTQYTGSTQILTESGLLVSNANIVVSPTTHQASVSGTVKDTSGNPIVDAQVSLALPNGSATNAHNYSSLIAITDANGAYTIPNIPSDAPSGGAPTITASTPGRQNQTATLGAFQPGGTYSQNFTLGASTGQSVNVPTILAVTTATEPTDSQSGRAIAAHATSGPTSVYDQLRRQLCPTYARTADRVAATGKRLVSHATGDYAIETDIAFNNVAQTGSLFGYKVYRTTGTDPTQAGVLPAETQQYYDFLQDPLANYYTDLTLSTKTNTTATGTQYNYALSALNTDGQETGLSSIFSITALGELTLTAPTVGQVYTGSATITWSQATGAQRYVVFVYDQYPSINVNPVYTSPTPLPAGTSTTTVSGLPAGQDYYVIVAGLADPVETLLPTATSSAAVTNGAMTFSQITRFHIQ